MSKNIGELVQIRSKEWFEKNKEYINDEFRVDRGESFYFSEDMLKYCGKIATIKEIKFSGAYDLDLDNGSYGWCDFMFEDVDIESIYEEDKKDELTLISFGDLYIAVNIITQSAIPRFFSNEEEFFEYCKQEGI